MIFGGIYIWSAGSDDSVIMANIYSILLYPTLYPTLSYSIRLHPTQYQSYLFYIHKQYLYIDFIFVSRMSMENTSIVIIKGEKLATAWVVQIARHEAAPHFGIGGLHSRVILAHPGHLICIAARQVIEPARVQVRSFFVPRSG